MAETVVLICTHFGLTEMSLNIYSFLIGFVDINKSLQFDTIKDQSKSQKISWFRLQSETLVKLWYLEFPTAQSTSIQAKQEKKI